MPSVNSDQLRDAAERLVKTYPEDLNTSFPEEIDHFQEYINEPKSDVWLNQKGENKGIFIALRMLQPLLTMICRILFLTCIFVYTFTCHFLSQTVQERGLFLLRKVLKITCDPL